jgi:transcriptional regulator with XRE-family HTH domain
MGKKTPTQVAVGKALRAVRENQGWTQNDVANNLGMAQPRLSQYENGTRALSVNSLASLGDFYCQPVSEFFPSQDEIDQARRLMADEEE